MFWVESLLFTIHQNMMMSIKRYLILSKMYLVQVLKNYVISYKTAASYLTFFSTGFSEGRYCYNSTYFLYLMIWLDARLPTVHQFLKLFCLDQVRLEVCLKSIAYFSAFVVMKVSLPIYYSYIVNGERWLEKEKKNDKGTLLVSCFYVLLFGLERHL